MIFLLLSLIIFSSCRFIVQLFTDDNLLLILIPVTVLTFFAFAKEYVYSLVDMMMSWTTEHPTLLRQVIQMLNSEQNVQVCDATKLKK